MVRCVGKRFGTWVETLDGVEHVWKSMDFAPPGREPSACYRELLGFQLGSRLGLAMLETRLFRHPVYGRVSVQRMIRGARPAGAAERQALALATTGLRILLLDLLARNPDRRAANLLVAGAVVFPIDFNVAFDYGEDTLEVAEAR